MTASTTTFNQLQPVAQPAVTLTQPRFVSPAGERARTVEQSHISAGNAPYPLPVASRGSWPDPINRHIGPYNFKPWVRVQGAASQSTLADCNRDFLISISITGIYYNIFIKPRSKQGRKKMVKYQADLSGSHRSCGNPTPPYCTSSPSLHPRHHHSFRLFTW